VFELPLYARNVLLGASLLGIAGGVLGCFALLRRQSLVGDALAHAALPGICLGYLLTLSKGPGALLGGAFVAGLAGAFVMLVIVRHSRIKEDTAIGIVLSVFFGFGIVLLTYIQKLPHGNQSGLDKFLFGQAATLMQRDVAIMAVLCGAALLLTMLFYKELKLLSFDPDFAETAGFSMKRLEALLTLLLVTVVVVGLQTVGVVLIVATLITPAAAARQWTERLGTMMLLAALIGGGAGVVGALISANVPKVPTGPVIVLCSSAVLVLSVFLAPSRGLLWATLRERGVARRIRRENLLKDLYKWGERHDGRWDLPVPSSTLMGLRGHTGHQLDRLARSLVGRKLLEPSGGGMRLTDRGLLEAEGVVRKHRLWEAYLSRRLELPSDHLHRDAETMEHVLTDAAVAELEELLGHPEVDPHGRPIPRRRAG